ncbi:MAG TPA: hypothetical protein VK668_21000 [Mucilaginibacter sp.]|nr:hypothetical protein [Mucilaginibacter sp.]
MKYLSLIIFLAIVQSTSAQIKSITLDKKAIPKSIHFAGHVINAVQYTDSEGEYIVITTETGIVEAKGEDSFRKADIYAYNFRIEGAQYTLTWQMHDFINDCDADTKAKYISNTFAITDLNKDGKGEVWLMYTTVCRSDVSSANMKIIMHEGNKKYAIRGTNRVKISDKDYSGGEYTIDETFKTGPVVFKQYALQLWKKNLNETWE